MNKLTRVNRLTWENRLTRMNRLTRVTMLTGMTRSQVTKLTEIFQTDLTNYSFCNK